MDEQVTPALGEAPLVRGCCVRRKTGQQNEETLQVETCSQETGRWRAKLKRVGADKNSIWCDVSELSSALKPGHRVIHIGAAFHPSLGAGTVQSLRRIAGREQALVLWDATGRSTYVPHERLARVNEPSDLFLSSAPCGPEDAERFILRLLGHALENWNALTGALDRLDVDPLPHQIQLVHRIVSSGNTNWLIADDVGLGKTIETGLLLAALKRSDRARRILIVCPASLTRQWQQELQYKFDQIFQIYGLDFTIPEQRHWDHYDHVIASLDLAKRPEHLECFVQSGEWDVVIFDEGHRLSRRGVTGERTERYVFAQTLRAQARGFIVLTATPHQGDTERFAALLELVRPDLRPQLHAIEAYPEVVRDIILRNRKSLVTDQNGEFIFKGHVTHRIAITPTPEVRDFHRALTRYLREGYKAGDEAGGATGRAIGFVMTTFRKLASSSVAAIEAALKRRLGRLHDEVAATVLDTQTIDAIDEEDTDDSLAAAPEIGSAGEFFAYEAEQLEALINSCSELRRDDPKLRHFMEEVVAKIVEQKQKLLIFTEYRATQSYLKEAIEQAYPGAKVAMINGSMKLEEKLDNIECFDRDHDFLISTEAGGEGLNLHRSCHILVNYDLPWNPTRLVQRIGRLYRYGQNKQVIVFNLHAEDSFDNKAISMMVDRITALVRDLSPVGDEFNEGVETELLGELLEQVDMGAVLEGGAAASPNRTQREVSEAIERARKAVELQREIFSHADGYDPEAVQNFTRLGPQHLERFVKGMCPFLGIRVELGSADGEVFVLRLPEEHRGRYREFGSRSRVRVTCLRGKRRAKDVVVLDAETDFLKALISAAKDPEFSDGYANIQTPGAEGVLGVFLLRWQDATGEPLTDELATFFLDHTGKVRAEPGFLSEVLLRPGRAGSHLPIDREQRLAARAELRRRADDALAKGATTDKHPNLRLAVGVSECTDIPE
ncbi:helicase [Marinicauda salina]|uniref:Helicase n=1 Tax=Marinicauda salina TaxID=2135793 RepID=A0A2U2BT33_9PROT|nr:DEAD/DEAH box helicase [Marinicauda salina]PWE17130.1 helicase [Marinicauda salina]